jgi:hypothetical protein
MTTATATAFTPAERAEYTELRNRLSVHAHDQIDWSRLKQLNEIQRAINWETHLAVRENDDYARFSQNFEDAISTACDLEGYAYYYGLATLDGELTTAKIVDGRYGQVWLIKKGYTADGREDIEWVNVSVASTVAKEQKFYEGKGYQLVMVRAQGVMRGSRWEAGMPIDFEIATDEEQN